MARRSSRERTVFYVRRFLNRPGHQTSAHIISYAKTGLSRHNGKPWWNFNLRISDCDRNINLEFYVDDPADRRNSIYKIDTLLTTLTKLRDAVYTASEQVEAWEAEREEDE